MKDESEIIREEEKIVREDEKEKLCKCKSCGKTMSENECFQHKEVFGHKDFSCELDNESEVKDD